ncbi:MAG: hypothetical protein Q7T20_13125 [Saprospiraceae bacterium]|nr:hypothetical protein [Saprospiraceae bacterium]
MKMLRSATLGPIITIFCLFVLNYGCQKNFLTEKPNTDPTDRTITLEEVMEQFKTDGNSDRSGERLPLYVRPLWDESYIVTNTGFPILMTSVDTPCSCPDTRYGGNLAFYKDPSGNIQSAFVIWETDSLSTYSSNRAPLDSSSQFSGMMALVNQQDTIEKVVQILNGRIMAAKKGKVAFADIPNEFIQGGPIANDRNPWDWWRNLWGGVQCPTWGSSGMDWSWWGNFWNGVGGLFGGQTWDGEAGEYISYPPGSFFFGGFEVGWGLPEGYNEPGGSGLFGQQFSNQISTCTAINEYIQSIGEIPQGYSSIDLNFCQLINEVGLNGTEGMCLFSQYGTSNIEDLLIYWNASNKDLATAEKIKAFIMGQCNGSFTPMLADLIKDNFCLSQHPIGLMENIKNQCGLSSFDSGEWFDAFNSGLSECTKSIILDDWFDLTNAEKDNLLNNPALYDQVVNFVKSKGCSEGAKDFALEMAQVQVLLSQIPGQPMLTLDDFNYLYDNIGGIEEAVIPPTNTPISVTNPLCMQILTFATRTDVVSGLQYAGMILQNSYFQFNVPGSTPVQIQTYNMKFNADANTNTACLVSCPAFAANAINIAVTQIQQLIDALPAGTSSEGVILFARLRLLRAIHQEFKTQVQNCNSNYLTDVLFQAGMFNNWNNLPVVNCDAEIVHCQ